LVGNVWQRFSDNGKYFQLTLQLTGQQQETEVPFFLIFAIKNKAICVFSVFNLLR
jgi:hypothetical protein